ncbi:FecR family protein [Carboxylicivirga marina]|uniref:FecR domain-containing protein n=1 Tax=Carboxylicivirga marina TaxID=2800988 RepID=A0ABS1HF10_9BACT|nr:FecR family protein [Carboxylicivirga marina]MBK3516196.1 FecR domain-containing protein [Carboxylicivirga marina]
MEVNQDILIQFIKGELSASEYQAVNKQIKSDKALFRQYIQLKDIWDYTASKSNALKYNEGKEWDTLAAKIPFASTRTLKFKRIVGAIAVAASIVIAFLIGHVYESMQSGNAMVAGSHVFKAPFGQVSNITLADGSKVMLNEGSTLTVPLDFGINNRNVALNGEGYFDVSTNKDLEFSVTSGKQKVKVLGTIFNIRAYEHENKMITTLEEGIVRWEMEARHITLKPGMQVIYDNQLGDVEEKTVDITEVKQWALGRYMYEDASLDEIIAVIERWHNVKVKWNPADFKGVHFNGVLKRSATIDETFELIKVMVPMKYTVKGQIVTIERMR